MCLYAAAWQLAFTPCLPSCMSQRGGILQPCAVVDACACPALPCLPQVDALQAQAMELRESRAALRDELDDARAEVGGGGGARPTAHACNRPRLGRKDCVVGGGSQQWATGQEEPRSQVPASLHHLLQQATLTMMGKG